MRQIVIEVLYQYTLAALLVSSQIWYNAGKPEGAMSPLEPVCPFWCNSLAVPS
jgi:hypothetical protein